MAHVLIGWELGGNRGHGVTIARIADRLRARGHRISFALQRADALTPEEMKGDAAWPVPLTPRLLINTAKPKTAHPATLGDIVVRLGADQPAMIGAMLASWRQLLGAIKPDLVIGQFAPFLLTAARGRVPTLACGTGFDTPPSAMARFPSLTGQPAVNREEEVVEALNAAAVAAGCRTIERLPELFGADVELPATFRELDPYAEWRTGPLVRPALALPDPELAPGNGEEVFVYAHEGVPADSPLWKGLAASRLPVRVHLPHIAYHRELEAMGLKFEPKPLPFPQIAARSRLVVSHGGHGFVCAALMAGLPQVICHYDIEKMLHGRALTRLGVGGLVPIVQIEPQPFAASLVNIYRDDAIAERARAAAPDFLRRYSQTMEESIADAVGSLA